jgi:hypothetical protein
VIRPGNVVMLSWGGSRRRMRRALLLALVPAGGDTQNCLGGYSRTALLLTQGEGQLTTRPAILVDDDEAAAPPGGPMARGQEPPAGAP